MEAARLTAVERMPAVSQVSTGPVGGLGKMQARQAVGEAGLGPRECTSLRSVWKGEMRGSLDCALRASLGMTLF